jgi:hypothetical protein
MLEDDVALLLGGFFQGILAVLPPVLIAVVSSGSAKLKC